MSVDQPRRPTTISVTAAPGLLLLLRPTVPLYDDDGDDDGGHDDDGGDDDGDDGDDGDAQCRVEGRLSGLRQFHHHHHNHHRHRHHHTDVLLWWW